MPVIIKCPNAACGKSMQLPDNAAGRRVQCPTCKQPFQVPAVAGVPVAAPATSPAAVEAPPPSSPSINLGEAGNDAKSLTPTKCPSCGAPLNEGAIACMDCG